MYLIYIYPNPYKYQEDVIYILDSFGKRALSLSPLISHKTRMKELVGCLIGAEGCRTIKYVP